MNNIVTIFSNVQDESTPFYPSVSDILNRIKTGNKSKELVEQVRTESDPGKISEIKKSIPVICFSAELYKIADNAVNKHSGLICLDFKGYKTKEEVLKAKAEICEDEYVYSVFRSLSGLGIKVLIKVPSDVDKHNRYFSALKSYFSDTNFDNEAYNVSRACYESFDPDIYINDDCELWDEEKNFKIPAKKSKSKSKSKSKAKAASPPAPAAYLDFWGVTDQGKIYLDQFKFKDFLVANGFYKFYPEGSKNFVFVRKISNRVANITDQYIKDFVLNYIEFKVKDSGVWSFFADKTRYFKEDFLSFLPKIEIKFVEDTLDSSYVFYRNTAVKVTKDTIDLLDYEDLDGWVWEDQMVDRDFELSDEHDCDFKQFIHNISDDDESRIKSVESTIGFLLHSYKDPSYCPAVILNDEVISDNPEGGTGKGLFANAISQIRKMVVIDGKNFRFDKSFPYQTVQQDTQTLTFDDVKSHFNLELLFSVITEGITLEKKNKDAIKIPFSHSPKILITTNYAIRGSGNSFERRKWELEFKQFYTKDYTPKDEFGHRLFDDWSHEQWTYFENYMLKNLSGYLETGFVESTLGNLKVRKFIAETSQEFFEWMSQQDLPYNKPKKEIVKKEAFMEFIEENPDYNKFGRFKLSNRRFNLWMDAYGEFRFGAKPTSGRNSGGQYLMFQDKELVQTSMNLKTK